MNKKETETYCFLFSFITLLISIGSLLFCCISVNEMNNVLSSIQKEVYIAKDTVRNNEKEIVLFEAECKDMIDDYTLYVDTVAKKVVSKEW